MEFENDIVIHPRRSKKEHTIPETGLFLVNPSEARYGLEAAEAHGARRQKFYNSNLFVNEEQKFFVAGPAIGAPFAVLTMEKLIALGATRVFLFGWCGSMSDSLSIGDLLLPTSAQSGEGTSAYYVSGSQPPPSSKLVESLRHTLKARDLPWSEGCVWSTDAPYREKRSSLKKLNEEYGVLAVDMEHSALCSVAFFRKIQFAAMLLVSDEVWGKNWKPGFTKQEFKARSRMLIDIFIEKFPR